MCVERYDTGRSVYKHGSRHVCEVYMTQVGQYTSMVVDMCVLRARYDTGRPVYKHGSRHVCVERYDISVLL